MLTYPSDRSAQEKNEKSVLWVDKSYPIANMRSITRQVGEDKCPVSI
jgi:hypothetical protein